MLDRRDFLQATIQLGRNQRIQLGGLFHAAMKHGIKMRRIAFVKAGEFARELVDGLCIVAAHQMLVQGLHDEFARPRTTGFARHFAGLGRFGGSSGGSGFEGWLQRLAQRIFRGVCARG